MGAATRAKKLAGRGPSNPIGSAANNNVIPLAVEPIGPGAPRPAHFLALVGRPYLWLAHFIGDVIFFFVYIAIMTGENLQ